jgi:hypothetical protein
MNIFGKLLREFRNKCNDPHRSNRRLSQERFGQLLGEELDDRGFSGTAVHYWENGESKIHKDDRIVLIAILKVLHKNGGVGSIEQAQSFLEAGNYRALDETEKQQIFPVTSKPKEPPQTNKFSWNGIFGEFQKITDKANDGPPPAWPRMMAAVMRNIGDRVESANAGRSLLWLLVWIFAYNLLTPSLQWPYSNQQSSINSLYLYIVGTLILPLLIGLLINTDQDPAWKEREGANPVIVRMYTYQGAFVGFHVGYFVILIICLIGFYLQIKPVIWFQFVLAGLPPFMGSMGAHVVPENLWLASERLSLSDGWIFFIFIPIGFVWAFFFLEYYFWLTSPILGAFIIITAMLLAIVVNRQMQKTSKV